MGLHQARAGARIRQMQEMGSKRSAMRTRMRTLTWTTKDPQVSYWVSCQKWHAYIGCVAGCWQLQLCSLLPMHRQQQPSSSPPCHLLTGDTAGSRAAKGPTGVQPLPNGKYTRAELASFEDSDAPPSLHSSEEPVTRMYYSDIDFATAKPANRGTASGAEPKTCSTWPS